MDYRKKTLCFKLKEAYGVEGLNFAYTRGKNYGCYYVGNDQTREDEIDYEGLDFILKALSMQQGTIYFADIDEWCNGLDELKAHYLVMKLAGIK